MSNFNRIVNKKPFDFICIRFDSIRAKTFDWMIKDSIWDPCFLVSNLCLVVMYLVTWWTYNTGRIFWFFFVNLSDPSVRYLRSQRHHRPGPSRLFEGEGQARPRHPLLRQVKGQGRDAVWPGAQKVARRLEGLRRAHEGPQDHRELQVPQHPDGQNVREGLQPDDRVQLGEEAARSPRRLLCCSARRRQAGEFWAVTDEIVRGNSSISQQVKV